MLRAFRQVFGGELGINATASDSAFMTRHLNDRAAFVVLIHRLRVGKGVVEFFNARPARFQVVQPFGAFVVNSSRSAGLFPTVRLSAHRPRLASTERV